MNDLPRSGLYLRAISLTLLLFWASGVFGHGHNHGGNRDCASYDEAAQHALQLMKQTPLRITAGRKPAQTPVLKPAQGYQITLSPQIAVDFVREPSRHRSEKDSHAGLLQFTTERKGRYRINISDSSWVDVLTETGELLESTAFSGRQECQPLRKYVEYLLPSKTPYFIQINGGNKKEITLIVTVQE